MANLGLVLVEFEHGRRPRVYDAHVVVTENAKKTDLVMAGDDNARRLKILSRIAHRFILASSAVCLESYSQIAVNASASAKSAMAWASLVVMADLVNVPLMVMRPQDVRDELEINRTAGGKRQKVSKADVEAAVRKICDVTELDAIVQGDARQHAIDATAVVLACTKLPPMQFLLG